MANSFKQFLNDDIVNTRNLLHEQVPITGSIISGSIYSEAGVNLNVRNETNGFLQSVYDFPVASASANHLMDITFGYSPNSVFSASTSVDNARKIQIYNQMAQTLVGHDASGSILEFDEDGDIAAGGVKIREAFFLCFSRLLTKDEIKKGSFSLELGQTDAIADANTVRLSINDAGANDDFRTNSPVGEYAILTSSNAGAFGLLYYQAGIAVLSASAFTGSSNIWVSESVAGNRTLDQAITGTSITGTVQGLRARIYNNEFNNTTEQNSTVHFVRLGNNEFNYSANPTYVSGSKINNLV